MGFVCLRGPTWNAPSSLLTFKTPPHELDTCLDVCALLTASKLQYTMSFAHVVAPRRRRRRRRRHIMLVLAHAGIQNSSLEFDALGREENLRRAGIGDGYRLFRADGAGCRSDGRREILVRTCARWLIWLGRLQGRVSSPSRPHVDEAGW